MAAAAAPASQLAKSLWFPADLLSDAMPPTPPVSKCALGVKKMPGKMRLKKHCPWGFELVPRLLGIPDPAGTSAYG